MAASGLASKKVAMVAAIWGAGWWSAEEARGGGIWSR